MIPDDHFRYGDTNMMVHILRDSREAYVLLFTPEEPTLWSHNVLLFESAASVWSFNRFDDILVVYSRTMILSPTMHYVDDYGSMEDSLSVNRNFESSKNTAVVSKLL